MASFVVVKGWFVVLIVQEPRDHGTLPKMTRREGEKCACFVL